MSVGGGGVGVHDQLLHGPVVLQGLAELGHVQQADGVGPLQNLVDVVADAPHLPDQQGHLGGRVLLHRRAVKDAAAVALTGQARLADFLCENFQFILREVDFYSAITFSHIASLVIGFTV